MLTFIQEVEDLVAESGIFNAVGEAWRRGLGANVIYSTDQHSFQQLYDILLSLALTRLTIDQT